MLELDKSLICSKQLCDSADFLYECVQMSGADRVLSALNFLTGEGANHYPDGDDANAIVALISDYSNEGQAITKMITKATTGMEVTRMAV